jgi:NADH-quinone oxidoreductase subunit L
MSILLFYNLLFAILASSIFGFYLGRINVYIIVISSLAFSLLLSIIGINEIILSLNILNVFLFEWLKLVIYVIDFMFYYDSLTTIMLFTIVGISTLVHIYSVGYLEYDPYLIRFLFFLAFFTFCMLLLVTASNFLQMFLG